MAAPTMTTIVTNSSSIFKLGIERKYTIKVSMLVEPPSAMHHQKKFFSGSGGPTEEDPFSE